MNSDKFALTDNMRSMTYKELDFASGQVYAWLKEKKIGKEDFVQIVLPHGIEVFVVCMGIWKAGAACVICEAEYPKERIDFIRKDVDAKAVIDEELYKRIIERESFIEGYTETDSHDAAFAVYTSGSSGNPKGVLHEYGNIDLIAKYAPITNAFALISPLNFIATLMCYIFVIKQGGTLFVIPYSITKNPPVLKDYFVRNNITEVYCAPSIYCLFSNIPSLKYIYISSEPAFGIWSSKSVLNVINIYAMSESGFIIATKKLTETNEVAPIGIINPGITVTLRDEEGKPAKNGKPGEICFVNPYVRGYINLPEETAKKFVNGETRTGDLAKKLSNGEYIILGRLDDMVNINGNRVEPVEVERAVKRVTCLKNVIAKGFSEGNSAFIVLYYTDDIELDANSVRTDMARFLPYYMIPTHFVQLKEFPRTKTGKLLRRLLPKPVFTPNANEYVPPKNKIEMILCDAFASVLELDSVGVLDDFYALGGSSVTSIELIAECNLAGLSVGMIYEGRTPRIIATLYQEFLVTKNGDIVVDLKKPYPLTQTQLVVYTDCMRCEGKAIYNNPRLYRLPLATNTARLQNAVMMALRAHLGLFCHIIFDGETVAMQYEPTLLKGDLCPVSYLSEAEFVTKKAKLVRAFNLYKDRLFRMEIFKTEKAVYLFADFHHIVFDGMSAQILFEDIDCAFNGKTIINEKYTAYHVAAAEVLMRQGEILTKARSWYMERLKGVKGLSIPKGDVKEKTVKYAKITVPFKLSRAEFSAFCASHNLSENVVAIGAFSHLLSGYTHEMNPTFTTAYNGRQDSRFTRVVSMLAKILPVHLNNTGDIKLVDYFTNLRDYLLGAMANDIYSFAEIADTTGISSDVEFIWQDKMLDVAKISDVAIEKVQLPFQSVGQILFVQLVTDQLNLSLKIRYQANRYSENFVRCFALRYENVLKQMMTKDRLYEVGVLNEEDANNINALSKSE